MKMNCYLGKRLYFLLLVVEICLWFVFLSCGVFVCGFMGDLYKEMVIYCLVEGYVGVISYYVDFLIFDVLNYFFVDYLKFIKKEIIIVRFKCDVMLFDL